MTCYLRVCRLSIRTIASALPLWLTVMTGLYVPADARSTGRAVGYVTRTWEPLTISCSAAATITVDYEIGKIISEGVSTPIHVDGATWDEVRSSVQGTQSYFHLSYPRFEVYVDSAFYVSRETAIQDYLDKLHPRHIALEEITGWTTEQFFNRKLSIYIFNGGTSCAYGYAFPAEVHLGLYPFFTDPSVCVNPSYQGGLPFTGNLGELGDQWIYWVVGLHENLHSINPFLIYDRSWLTEGLAQYFGYNILASTQFNDINQETADHHIQNAAMTPQFGTFAQYIANDYRDLYGSEIQQAAGYDITAWMLSMMRDIHGLDWNVVRQVIQSNPETTARAEALDPNGYPYITFFTDTYAIDVIGRASGLSFEQVQAIWRYDGPSGPGWGVRHWEDREWYGDLTPTITWTCAGDSLDVEVWAVNVGGTALNDAEIALTRNGAIIVVDTVSVPAQDSMQIGLRAALVPDSFVALVATIDAANRKIESDETNNTDSVVMAGNSCVCICACHADPACDSVRSDISDVVSTINVAFRGSPPVTDLQCLRERTDVDCDGSTNVVDVIKTIDVAFRGADASSRYCSPCTP